MRVSATLLLTVALAVSACVAAPAPEPSGFEPMASPEDILSSATVDPGIAVDEVKPEPQPSPTPEPDAEVPPSVEIQPVPEGTAVIYRRSGGVAGIMQEWLIFEDGRVLSNNGLTWKIEPEEVAQLQEELEAWGFFDLEKEYIPQDQCCDRFTYAITLTNKGYVHTVSALEGNPEIPRLFWVSLQIINDFLSEAMKGSNVDIQT